MNRPVARHPSYPEGLDGSTAAATGRAIRKGMLRVRIANDGHHCTVEPEGEVDLSNAGVLEQAIQQVEPSSAETITVDLRRMHFIDLSGVRAILNADARLEGRLRLVKGPPAVQSVFQLTGAEAELPFETLAGRSAAKPT